MANNTHRYGFRWCGNLEGGMAPRGIECLVASGYQASAGGNVDLNIGDPVMWNNSNPDTGFLELATAGGTGRFFGVIAGFINARVDANGRSRPSSYLPGGTTWTNEVDRSRVVVIPFGRNIWEIDVTGNGSFTTLTLYRTLVNKNCDLAYSRDATVASRPKANPLLDVSTNAETTKDFRVIAVSGTAMNQDFSGNFVKLRVVVNETGEAPFVAAV